MFNSMCVNQPVPFLVPPLGAVGPGAAGPVGASGARVASAASVAEVPESTSVAKYSYFITHLFISSVQLALLGTRQP